MIVILDVIYLTYTPRFSLIITQIKITFFNYHLLTCNYSNILLQVIKNIKVKYKSFFFSKFVKMFLKIKKYFLWLGTLYHNNLFIYS